MKKVLSGILALMIAGTITLPAFAEVGDITAEEVKIDDGTENLVDLLKTTADEEEGMLRIAPSNLLKIKLKLESDGAEGTNMSFLANKKLENGAAISNEDIQFIDEKTIAADGTVTIQFRPRENQSTGIYNMRANAKDATMFSKFYKTVADEIQPSLSNPDSVALGKNITLTVSGYTEAWKNANNL